MKLITIRKSNIESELSILRSKLESEGIACFMKNELTTQIMNFLPSFEIELQIRDSDLDKAKEITSKMMDK